MFKFIKAIIGLIKELKNLDNTENYDDGTTRLSIKELEEICKESFGNAK